MYIIINCKYCNGISHHWCIGVIKQNTLNKLDVIQYYEVLDSVIVLRAWPKAGDWRKSR